MEVSIINSWGFLLFTFILLLLLLTYQDIRYHTINSSFIYSLLPSFIIKWLFISDYSLLTRLSELVFIVFLLFTSKYLTKQLGKGDILVLILMILLFGGKDTMVIVMISLIGFILSSCIFIIFKHKKLKINLPFIPYLLIGQIIYLMVKGSKLHS